MRKETTIKRLKMLADLLDNHQKIFPKMKLQMHFWSDKNFLDKETKCVTAACALGSAACYPPFKKLGLKLGGLTGARPEYKGYQEYGAGAFFFGITYNESYDLFDPESYISFSPRPATVAKKVKKLIEKIQRRKGK